ncbi:MAG: SDR family oxidoreductase [Rhodanobacter sp.]|jgi:NAD(P)-dependent dehydrogenase (short-subunit alcohol dehydrogenase family)
MNDVTHPIALITGGSRGLGKNTALKLAEQGSDVILTYVHSKDAAEAVVVEIEKLGRQAIALPLDVGKSAGFDAFASQVREVLSSHWQRTHFNHLVNNAGSGLHVPFADTTEAQFDQMVAEHLKAPFFLTQKMLPLLADGGRIINISSGLARFSFPGSSAYASMKGGVEVLTRYMARELGERGITANVIAPGAIETDFSGGRVRDNPAMNQQIASMTALGRVGLPDDIGGAIASLLQPGNRWITGQRIEASGGMLL